MTEQIEQLHQRLGVIMQEIHEICIKNNIRYTLLGGTLIGAVRHKGFIPWDDDLDIAMPYSDYKKFVEVVFSQDHDWLEFALAGKTENYYNPFIKAYDKRTTFIESALDTPKGVFVDIFPVVYSGNTRFSSIIAFAKHRLLLAPLVRKAYQYKDKNIIKEAVLTILGRMFSVDFFMNRITKHYEKLNKKATKYCSDMDGNTHGIVLSSYFSEYVDYPFEQYTFRGIKNADGYLRDDFGDYMQLPPVEKRKPHHIEYLNLNLPYREYVFNKGKSKR